MELRRKAWLIPLLALPVVAVAEGGLTGDWGGSRTSMSDKGLAFRLESTSYYQGLLQGTGSKSWDYGGRLDGYISLDTGKAGLWDGGLFRMHAEYYYGNLNANLGGVVAPSNLGVRLPNGDPEEVAITSFHLVQQLGGGKSLIAGVINTVDLIEGHPFLGGAGFLRFWNLAFAAPPNGLLPPVIIGAIVSVPTKSVGWTFMAYDSEDRTRGGWFDHLFSDVNVSVSGKYSFKLAGQTSSLALTGIYSTKDGADLGQVLLPPSLQTGVKNDSWHASLQFDHFFHENTDRPGTGYGFFVKMGASDGNPNPYQAFITGGIGGKGMIASRPDDFFGIGYFYYNLSNDLQDALNPTANFKDEQGIEVTYEFAANSWLHVGADLQYTDPAAGDNDKAFSAGLRARITF